MSAPGFAEAMRNAGLVPPDTIEPDKWHRFSTNHEPGDDAGWCKLFSDGMGGVFGDHRSGLSETWQAEQERPNRHAEPEALRRRCEPEQVKRETAAKETAASILEGATGEVATHPYAQHKKAHLGRLVKRGTWYKDGFQDALIVPIYGVNGEVWTLQAINADGHKDFLKGGRKRGGFHPFGKIHGAARVLIGEGLATVAAAVDACGLPAVAAMDCGNLKLAACSVRELAPGCELIFLADNDVKPDGSNPGIEAATKAAQALGGRVAVPDLDGRVCDWWDVWTERGRDAVRAGIEADTASGTGWPNPQPLVAKWAPEPYPVDALPAGIRAAVEEVQAFVKAPVALVASSALGALSLAIQAHADVKRVDKLQGPSSLFLLTIADSGERKSTCDGFFAEEISNYEREQAEVAKPLILNYKVNAEAWDAKRNGIKDQIRQLAKGNKPTEDLETTLRGLEHQRPEAPRLPKLIRGDETPENLAWVLAKEWPSGGVMSSEAGIVLGASGMGKDSIMRNLALLNVLWDGGKVSIGRRTSDSFDVRGARLTVALQVQEATLRNFLRSSGELARGIGFLARFLVAWPESTQGFRPFMEAPQRWPALEAFNRRIGEVLRQAASVDEDGGLSPAVLSMSPDAKTAWAAYHDEIEAELPSGGELHDVRDAASKSADNAARLAALFHVFNGETGPISAGTFESASQIAAWYLSESRRFFGELTLPEELADATRLDGWLLGYCQHDRAESVSKNHVRRYGPLRDGKRLNAAIAELEGLDRLRLVEDGKRLDLHVNPALLRGPA